MRLYTLLLTLFCIGFGQTMAVLDFDAKGVSESEASALNDRLNQEMHKHGIFTLIERGQIKSIIEEQGFQQSGCTTSECAVEVGGLLGAQKIVVGRVSRIGLLYTVSARIVDVQTGIIDHIASYDHRGQISLLLSDGITHVATELMRPYGANPVEKPKKDKKSLHFIAYDDPPEPLKEIKPKYPSKAKKLGIEVTVIVETFIDKKGRVKDHFVLQGLSENSLNQAALKAIKRARFKPAQYNGEAIGVWISIPVIFSINK
jgi:TonB family protein